MQKFPSLHVSSSCISPGVRLDGILRIQVLYHIQIMYYFDKSFITAYREGQTPGLNRYTMNGSAVAGYGSMFRARPQVQSPGQISNVVIVNRVYLGGGYEVFKLKSDNLRSVNMRRNWRHDLMVAQLYCLRAPLWRIRTWFFLSETNSLLPMLVCVNKGFPSDSHAATGVSKPCTQLDG